MVGIFLEYYFITALNSYQINSSNSYQQKYTELISGRVTPALALLRAHLLKTQHYLIGLLSGQLTIRKP